MSSPPTASATAEQQQQRARCWVRVDTESGQLCLDDTSAGFDQVLGRSGEDGTDNPTDATPPTLPVVSVQGLARTGKSTLMNVLAGNDGCFEARGGDTSVTTGVQGVLLVGAQHLAGTPGTETGDMVLLDNEGSGEDDSVTDMQELFTLEQSQLTIYNYSHANGVVQKQTLLRALSRYAQHHGTYARRRGSDDSRDECGDEDAGGGATGARRRWGALLILVRDCDCSGSSESPAEWEDRMFERVFGSARNGVGMAQAVLDTFTDVCFHAMPNLHGLSAQQRASLPAVVQLRARLEGLLAAGSRQVPLLRCSELRAYGSQFIDSINAAGPIPSPFDLLILRDFTLLAHQYAQQFKTSLASSFPIPSLTSRFACTAHPLTEEQYEATQQAARIEIEAARLKCREVLLTRQRGIVANDRSTALSPSPAEGGVVTNPPGLEPQLCDVISHYDDEITTAIDAHLRLMYAHEHGRRTSHTRFVSVKGGLGGESEDLPEDVPPTETLLDASVYWEKRDNKNTRACVSIPGRQMMVHLGIGWFFKGRAEGILHWTTRRN
jgi:hypothetical protein